MRKARYDMRQVFCRNATTLGYTTKIARPGCWITWNVPGLGGYIGRVLGRIARAEGRYQDDPLCEGWLAAITLSTDNRSAFVRWVNPDDVTSVYEQAPAQLLAWITSPEWVKSKDDIARIIAMSEHGTLCEQFIDRRDLPEQAYNARPEYVQQFILKD